MRSFYQCSKCGKKLWITHSSMPGWGKRVSRSRRRAGWHGKLKPKMTEEWGLRWSELRLGKDYRDD